MGVEDATDGHAFERTAPAIADEVGRVRHAVVELARRNGAVAEVQQDLGLAVGEACANVVVHAYPPGEEGPLIVHATITPDGEIVVTVGDNGSGMMPRPDSPGLGLGLPLIANLAGRLEIRSGPNGVGTELMMAFALKP